MRYTLMNKKMPVVDLDIDEQTLYVKEILATYNLEYRPYAIRKLNRESVSSWLLSRKIPASRDNIDELLENLNLASTNSLIFKSLALSLSDQYRLRPFGKAIQWEEVNFFDNDFSDDLGKFLFENNKEISSLKTPDNTSNGDLKKSWKIIGGKRVLLKAGRPPYYQEPYNEILASEICKRMDFDYVDYKAYMIKGRLYSGSEDFITRDTELVSARDLIKDEYRENHLSPYDFYLGICQKLGLDVRKEVNDMLVLDYIICNEDRHYRNFGLIRDVESLEFIKAAPIFDSGSSMGCQQADRDLGYGDKSKPFRDHHSKQIGLVDLSKYDFSKLYDIGDFAYDLYSKNEEMEGFNSNRKIILSKLLEKRVGNLKTLQKEAGRS